MREYSLKLIGGWYLPHITKVVVHAIEIDDVAAIGVLERMGPALFGLIPIGTDWQEPVQES